MSLAYLCQQALNNCFYIPQHRCPNLDIEDISPLTKNASCIKARNSGVDERLLVCRGERERNKESREIKKGGGGETQVSLCPSFDIAADYF